MKKLLMATIMAMVIFSLTSCSATEKLNNLMISEWVSPDGVHYWEGSYGALSPRYDNNGELIIDEK